MLLSYCQTWCGFLVSGRRYIYSFKEISGSLRLPICTESVPGFGKSRSLCPPGGWPCQFHSLFSFFSSITIFYKKKLYKWVFLQFNWKWLTFTRRCSWPWTSSSKSIFQKGKLIFSWTAGAMSIVSWYTINNKIKYINSREWNPKILNRAIP